MKKVIIIILILLFAFAFIRIATSTYENLTREKLESESIPKGCFFLFLYK